MNDPNPDLSLRSKYLSREMTAWDYSAIESLFDGDEEFALYMREADHEAVFFHAHGRCWLYTRYPSAKFDQAAPEVVEDWIGASAPKEPGAEPVLMHREELPQSVKAIIEQVNVVEPEHVYDQLREGGESVVTDDDRRCTRCGQSVEDLPYEFWMFHSCRHCSYEADGRWRDTGTYRKWRYFPRWHMTEHPDLPERLKYLARTGA